MSGQQLLNLNMLLSEPQNKNVEKWSGQLKFEFTDLDPHLHEITGLFYGPKINFKSLSILIQVYSC